MKRNTNLLCLFVGLISAILAGQRAEAASGEQFMGSYGAGWRSFSVYSATTAPAVNTYSMKFATGIQITGDRVQLVENGGKFVRNGHSRQINPTTYAHVDLRPKTVRTSRQIGRRKSSGHRVHRAPSSRVKVPVMGHAGRLVGKLFSRKNRRAA